MAIDTAKERRSAATTSVAWGPASVSPDATTPALWRAASGWSYMIDASVTTPPVVLGPQIWFKSNPVAQFWAKANPDDEIWSVT